MAAFHEFLAENELFRVLGDHGFDIGPEPHHQSQPRPLLIRGDNHLNFIMGKESNFSPHSGQMGSWGVFLADTISAVMFGDVYYVFHSSRLLSATGEASWLNPQSTKWNDLFDSIAAKKRLNTRTLSGGLEAETEIYKHYPIYEPNLGIATIPTSVSIAMADKIMIKKQTYETVQNRIPSYLLPKVVIF
ncbi:MAG TPA: hypothetical protein VMR81_01385 [Patescibacteria group bacterium]|nr:hypothetical protein [Patescibacteria group bacterium]